MSCSSSITMAPATRSSVGHTSGFRFSPSNYAEVRVGNIRQTRASVQRRHGLDRQAERSATLPLASCVPLLLLLLLMVGCWRGSAVDVAQQYEWWCLLREPLSVGQNMSDSCRFFFFKLFQLSRHPTVGVHQTFLSPSHQELNISQ